MPRLSHLDIRTEIIVSCEDLTFRGPLCFLGKLESLGLLLSNGGKKMR